MAVDLIGSASRMSNASSALFLSPPLQPLSCFYFPLGLQGFFHLHAVPTWPTCDTEPNWNTCLQNKSLQNQDKLPRSAIFTRHTFYTYFKTVRILCSIPGSFFSQGPLGPQQNPAFT